MPLYIADYLGDAAHLNTAEHGAYLLLLMHYWSKGRLPPSEDAIQRITRMTNRQWKKSRDVLKSFFTDDWRHHRVEKEIAQAVEKSRVNSANAAKSHVNRKQTATAIALESPPTLHTPESTPQEDALPSVARRADGQARSEPPLNIKISPRIVVHSNTENDGLKPNRRPRALPADWKPSLKSYEIAVQFGQNVQMVEGIFRDYVASSGKLYIDHDAAFHNFIRNQSSFSRGGNNGVRQNGSPGRGSIVHAADLAIAKLEREIAAISREIEGDNEVRQDTILGLPDE